MQPNVFLPWQNLRRELLEVLTLSYSRHAVHYAYEKLASPTGESFRELAERIDQEFQGALLNVATLIRAHDNRFRWNDPKGVFFRRSDSGPPFATLYENGKKKPIGLRDVCNKILHASSITLNGAKTATKLHKYRNFKPLLPVPSGKAVFPIVTMERRQGRDDEIKWKVVFEVFGFVMYASELRDDGPRW